MELKSLVKELHKNYLLILTCSFIGLALSYYVGINKKSYYLFSYPLYINSLISESTSFNNWQDPTDTIIGVIRHNQEKGLSQGSISDVKKITNKLILISVKNQDSKIAANDIQNYFNLSEQKISVLTANELQKISLQKLNSLPDQSSETPNRFIISVVGYLLGATFGTSIVFLKNYFRK